MTTNFTISYDHEGDSLHLKLAGDFDGTAADELFNVIQWYGRNKAKIFIHTGNLRSIHPFGQILFLNKRSLIDNRSFTLAFKGKHRHKMMPESDEVSWVNI